MPSLLASLCLGLIIFGYTGFGIVFLTRPDRLIVRYYNEGTMAESASAGLDPAISGLSP